MTHPEDVWTCSDCGQPKGKHDLYFDGECENCHHQKMEEMRDALEDEIVINASLGDTTVLSELLSKLDNKTIYNALSDNLQKNFQQFK